MDVAQHWLELRNAYAEYSDAFFLCIAFSIVHGITFWGINGLLAICYKLDLFKQWQILPGKHADSTLVWKCVLHNAVNHLVGFPIAAYAMFHFVPRIRMTGPIGTPLEIALQLFGCMVCEDFFFYWGHRSLHHPAVYKYIHKQHHTFRVSIGIASEYAHPVEAIYSNLIPFISGPLLLRVHAVTFLVWTFLRIWETIDAHSGYAFPISPWHFLSKFQGGSEKHDFHHSHNVGSYGSFFTFWDWVCGTDRAFKEHLAKKAARQAAAAAGEEASTASGKNVPVKRGRSKKVD